MARLVSVLRGDEVKSPRLKRMQIPLYVDDSLTMVMEFPDNILNLEAGVVNTALFKQFQQCYAALSPEELSRALWASPRQALCTLPRAVPCVGCRGSVERLLLQLAAVGGGPAAGGGAEGEGAEALRPLMVGSAGELTVTGDCRGDPRRLYCLFYTHGLRLKETIEAIPHSKKNRRCHLHSMDTHRPKPLGGSWLDVWDLMSPECREEAVLIDSDCLLETLDAYLQKHRFCSECRGKVLRAYSILVGDVEGPADRGFSPSLYEGLRCCSQERHVHVRCDTDYVAHLLGRAEPEFTGSYE
ncbi:gametogenetin-binding protein 2-like [Petromyzon marinus]|uniref:gametogenetin-binding protein 2-like n=1 Tax=Petromyzon marinus TaxID=7757 RepID=UPI003F71B392